MQLNINEKTPLGAKNPKKPGKKKSKTKPPNAKPNIANKENDEIPENSAVDGTKKSVKEDIENEIEAVPNDTQETGTEHDIEENKGDTEDVEHICDDHERKTSAEEVQKHKDLQKLYHGLKGVLLAEKITLTRQNNSWVTNVTDEKEKVLMKGTSLMYKWGFLCRKGKLVYEFYDPQVGKKDPDSPAIKIEYITYSLKEISILPNKLNVSIDDICIGRIVATCFGYDVVDDKNNNIFKVERKWNNRKCSGKTTYLIKVVGAKINTGSIEVEVHADPKKTTYKLTLPSDDAMHASLLLGLIFRMLADSLLTY